MSDHLPSKDVSKIIDLQLAPAEVHGSSRAVVCTDANGNNLHWFKSQKIAGRELEITPSNISNVCRGRQKQSHGLYFRHAKPDEISQIDNPTSIVDLKAMKVITGRGNNIGKSIVCIDNDGNVLYWWKSITDAERELDIGRHHQNGLACDNDVNIYGYKFRFASNYENEASSTMTLEEVQAMKDISYNCNNAMSSGLGNPDYVIVPRVLHSTTVGTKRAIYQCDLEGNIIKTHDSIRGAGKDTGIDSGGISRCCKGKGKTAGGFIWRFVHRTKEEREED